MKQMLLAAAAACAIAVAAPANAAVNTAIIMWNGSAIETATGTGSADLTAQDLNGVTVTLSFVSRATKPDQLTEGNINIDNTTGSVETLHIIAGANDYVGTSSEFKLTGTIGVTSGMVDLSGDYFVDGANVLNGTGETVVGTSINNFDSGILNGPFSFSKNQIGGSKVTGPYGLAEALNLTLDPGASVFVQGVSMTAIPEPKTWTLMGVGFGLLGLIGFRRAKAARYAI